MGVDRSSTFVGVGPRSSKTDVPVLDVRHMTKVFTGRSGILGRSVSKTVAVDDVSLVVYEGETLALVGESGSGKTTAGRLVLDLIPRTRGEVRFRGSDVDSFSSGEKRAMRRHMQIIFQDALGSLNPRQVVGSILANVVLHHKLTPRTDAQDAVFEVLKQVGLEPPEVFAARYPHELSGGQRQRVVIARAILTSPSLIVADEPVSALDMSIRGQVLNLLMDLQTERGISYLFISHDLAIVRSIANRVAVMYLGAIVESGPVEAVLRTPRHPYAQALTAATLPPHPEAAQQARANRIVLRGDQPSPNQMPSGCRFHTRCPVAERICTEISPPMVHLGGGHIAACHLLDSMSEPSSGNGEQWYEEGSPR